MTKDECFELFGEVARQLMEQNQNTPTETVPAAQAA